MENKTCRFLNPPLLNFTGKDKQSIDKVDLASMDTNVHIYCLDPLTRRTSYRQVLGTRSMVDFEKYLSLALTLPPPALDAPFASKVNRRQSQNPRKIYRKESKRDKVKEKAIEEKINWPKARRKIRNKER